MPHIFEKSVADLAKVPEPFQPFYTDQGDGSFVMDDSLFSQLDHSTLHSALGKERKTASALKKDLEAFQTLGTNPAEIQAKLVEMQETLAKKDAHAGQFEKYKTELDRAKAEDLSKKDAEIAKMRGSLMEYLVNSEATRVLSEAKGSPDLLLPIIQKSAKVIEENGKYVVRIADAEGDPRYTSSGSFMSLADLVAEMRSHPQYGKAFEPSGTSGSGMRPGAPTQGGRAGSVQLSRAEAKDPVAYRRAREIAQAQGRQVEIID